MGERTSISVLLPALPMPVVNSIEPSEAVAIGSDVTLGCDTAPLGGAGVPIIVRINHVKSGESTTLQVQQRTMV